MINAHPLRSSAFLAAVLILFAVFGSPAVAESWELIPPNPQVGIEYRAPRSPELESVHQSMQKRKALEAMQRFLSPLHLPHHLQLVMLECDPDHNLPDHGENAFYNPFSREIWLCYEFIAAAAKSAPESASPDGFITREASS